MKKIIFFLIGLFSLTFASCLKSGLEDLPEFEDNDITEVPRVEYRFISDAVSNASNQNIVKYVGLTINSKNIDKNAKKVTLEVTVPPANTDFSAAERAKVSKENLVVVVAVSTAARVFPIGDAPRLGTPGNWSKPNQYRVEAANGDSSEWTIEVTTLNL